MNITKLGAVLAAGIATAGLASAAGAVPGRIAHAPVNLIRDASAEGATPDSLGSKVHIKGWTVGHSDLFTAVGYGATGFPTDHSPGPIHHGKNFFAGGPDGASAKGTQVDSLRGYRHLISAGNAKFTLAAWIGGYRDQADHATVSVTWLNGHGHAVGDMTVIGPVGPAARHDRTGMLYRHQFGLVPRGAHNALITVRMARAAGKYNDGYADRLSLTIVHE